MVLCSFHNNLYPFSLRHDLRSSIYHSSQGFLLFHPIHFSYHVFLLLPFVLCFIFCSAKLFLHLDLLLLHLFLYHFPSPWWFPPQLQPFGLTPSPHFPCSCSPCTTLCASSFSFAHFGHMPKFLTVKAIHWLRYVLPYIGILEIK